jgi:hypothetical protein
VRQRKKKKKSIKGIERTSKCVAPVYPMASFREPTKYVTMTTTTGEKRKRDQPKNEKKLKKALAPGVDLSSMSSNFKEYFFN